MITIILSIAALLVAGYALWLAREVTRRLDAQRTTEDELRSAAERSKQVVAESERWDQGWGSDGWK